MPRRRIPAEVAKVTGRDLRDPARYANRAEHHGRPLGEASDFLDENGRAAWADFCAEFPWLQESDRALLEIASTLRGRLIAGEIVGLSALAQLRYCLSAMGGSPCDRSKVDALPDDQPDPLDEFLN